MAATLLGAGTAYLAVVGRPPEPIGYAVASPAAAAADPTVTDQGGSRVAAAAAAPVDDGQPAEPPTRIAIERLGIDMAVRPQGVDPLGRMQPPADPAVAGWYRFGPAPASQSGAVVLAAHVDSRAYGVGPFARLTSARAGDEVLVDAGSVRWQYRVVQVDRAAKSTLDTSQLFATEGTPRLHIVTCTGRYDRQTGYEANLVIVAERVRGGV